MSIIPSINILLLVSSHLSTSIMGGISRLLLLLLLLLSSFYFQIPHI